jgi:hypothetical protein
MPNIVQLDTQGRYAELIFIVLDVVMLSVIMPSVVASVLETTKTTKYFHLNIILA